MRTAAADTSHAGPRARLSRLAILISAGLVVLAAGCGLLEERVGLACQEPVELAPQPDAAMELLPDLIGRSPAEASQQLRDAGASNPSWRYQYATEPDRVAGYSECWCVPPPDGEVIAADVTDGNRLIVMVQRAQPMLGGRPQPTLGWGCEE